jgi:hypothetical protein
MEERKRGKGPRDCACSIRREGYRELTQMQREGERRGDTDAAAFVQTTIINYNQDD